LLRSRSLLGLGWYSFALLSLFQSSLPLFREPSLLSSGVDGLLDCVPPFGLGVGIELDEEAQVLEGIQLPGDALGSPLLGVQMRLDFLRVDDAAQVRVGQSNTWESESNFDGRGVFVCSIDVVEFFECGRSPDDESTKVTTRSEFKKVQARNSAQLNSRNIPKCLEERSLFVIYDQRSASLNVAPIPQLTLSGADFL